MYKILFFLLLAALSVFAQTNESAADSFEKEKNTAIFNTNELNNINAVQYKITLLKESDDDKDLDLADKLAQQRDLLIKNFMDDLALGSITLVDASYQANIDKLNQEARKYKKNGNNILELTDIIKIRSLKLDASLQSFTKNVMVYLGDFKKKEAFDLLFMDFKEELLFNLQPFEKTYTDLTKKTFKTEDDLKFITAYNHYQEKIELYRIIFNYAKNRTDRIISTNLVLDRLNIEYIIKYFNNLPSLYNLNAFIYSNFSVTIGQIVAAIIVFLLIIALRNPVVPYILNLIERLLYGARKKTSEILEEHHRGKTFSRYLRESLYVPFSYILTLAGFDIALRIILISRDNVKLVHYLEIVYVIFIAWGIFRLLNNFVYFYSNAFLEKYPNVRGEMVNFFVNLLKLVIVAFFILLEMHNAGFNITGILASLGIGGLAVALAARDTLTNIFGSISIIMDNMFSQGDWIATERAEGTVVDIGMRTTKIRTFDNAMIFIPNSYLANTDIKNWHKRKLGRRIKMSIGVTYDSKMDDVINAVNEIREMLEKHPGVANKNIDFDYNQEQVVKIIKKEDEFGVKKTLLVYLDEFGPSSMNILIYCFTKTIDWEEWLTTKQDVMVQIAKILEKNNLEFAFPSQSIYFKNEGGQPFEIKNETPER